MQAREKLRALIIERSLRRGDFVLSSGKRSSYYIDARLTTMSGLGQKLIGELGLDLLDRTGWKVQSIGGLTLGADPVAYAIAHTAALRGRVLDAFTVRKEPKAHGTGRLIEGVLEPGWSVAVIEDTITTGESALRAVHAVRAAGGSVAGVLALVDRQEDGLTRLSAENLEVTALFTAAELLESG